MSETVPKMYIGLHVKSPLFFFPILKTDFSKKTQIKDFMKFCPVGAELFYADRRTDELKTDTTKLIVAFRNVANAPKISYMDTVSCRLSVCLLSGISN